MAWIWTHKSSICHHASLFSSVICKLVHWMWTNHCCKNFKCAEMFPNQYEHWFEASVWITGGKMDCCFAWSSWHQLLQQNVIWEGKWSDLHYMKRLVKNKKMLLQSVNFLSLRPPRGEWGGVQRQADISFTSRIRMTEGCHQRPVVMLATVMFYLTSAAT